MQATNNIKFNNPPMENLPVDSAHGTGILSAMVSIVGALLSIFSNADTLIRAGAGVAAIVSAVFASCYYRLAYLEKKESLKKLKSNR